MTLHVTVVMVWKLFGIRKYYMFWTHLRNSFSKFLFSLSGEQSEILKEKIKCILPDDDQRQNEIEKSRNNLFQNVWAQRNYNFH